jgi:hypothetical protein
VDLRTLEQAIARLSDQVTRPTAPLVAAATAGGVPAEFQAAARSLLQQGTEERKAHGLLKSAAQSWV